jgi:hypothetical protein
MIVENAPASSPASPRLAATTSEMRRSPVEVSSPFSDEMAVQPSPSRFATSSDATEPAPHARPTSASEARVRREMKTPVKNLDSSSVCPILVLLVYEHHADVRVLLGDEERGDLERRGASEEQRDDDDAIVVVEAAAASLA